MVQCTCHSNVSPVKLLAPCKIVRTVASVAREYVKRIEFIYTPKHGSWLNVAECELSSPTRQCLVGHPVLIFG